MTAAEAKRAIAAAARAGVFLMEGFAFRVHPLTQRLVELLRARAIGNVRMLQATFGYVKPYDPASRYFARSLGGGAILGVGGSCMAMARLIAGIARGEPFSEPIHVRGSASLAPTGVDQWAVAELVFPDEILAQLCTANSAVLDNRVRIFGSQRRDRAALALVLLRQARRRDGDHRPRRRPAGRGAPGRDRGVAVRDRGGRGRRRAAGPGSGMARHAAGPTRSATCARSMPGARRSAFATRPTRRLCSAG